MLALPLYWTMVYSMQKQHDTKTYKTMEIAILVISILQTERGRVFYISKRTKIQGIYLREFVFINRYYKRIANEYKMFSKKNISINTHPTSVKMSLAT